MLRFRSLAIFNLLPSLPSRILHLPSMQDQVVERLEQLYIDQIKRSTIRQNTYQLDKSNPELPESVGDWSYSRVYDISQRR
jgi:hypothetical protein